jgi:hypothetical protein
MALKFVVTANRVVDGSVVYLAVDRTWASRLDASYRTDAEPERDALLAWAKTQEREICDPYAVEVEETADRVTLQSVRERIRADGPAVVLARLGYAGQPKPGLHVRAVEPPAKRSA